MIKSRRMIWAEHVARIGEKKNAYTILVEKPEGKRPLGRPRRRCVIILKWILERLHGMGWIDLGRDMALVNTVMNLPFP
jgi:hypothetical protein